MSTPSLARLAAVLQRRLFWSGIVLAVVAGLIAMVSIDVDAVGMPEDAHPGGALALAAVAFVLIYASGRTPVPVRLQQRVAAPAAPAPPAGPPASARAAEPSDAPTPTAEARPTVEPAAGGLPAHGSPASGG